MKIAIAGGSGFIGAPLVQRLSADSDVVVLTRNPGQVRAGRGVEWHPPSTGGWAGEVASADVVINLAGENIGGGRWTEDRKRALLSSRIDATTALVEAMKQEPTRRRTFISASAVGYYGLRGDEKLDEKGSPGGGFLAEICRQWEAAAHRADAVAHVAIVRFGVVLAKDGGALGKMLLPFRLGAGGPIGSGNQWMSWIGRDDVVGAIAWLVERQGGGVYNLTAPEPVRNREFAKALGQALHRPAFMPLPAFALRIAFGEMADEMLLGGQRVIPSRLESEGFKFAEPALGGALARILE